MEVKMLKTDRGSPNGLIVNIYEEGRTYDLPDDLARAFVDMGSAKQKTAAGRPRKEVVEEKKEPNE